MDVNGLLQVRTGVARDRAVGRDPSQRLLRGCVDLVDVTGAGITVRMEDGPHLSLGGSDAAIRFIEELQFTLGVGPCVDACRTGEPVLEPALAHPEVDRWPGLAEPAVDAGVEAIFGFPLRHRGVALGALDLYRAEPGALSPTQHADALVMADVVAQAILDLQADAAPGALAFELDQPEYVRSVVHQATGMLSVQLSVPVPAALSRLRAYAYASGTSVDDLATSIVDRSLRIE